MYIQYIHIFRKTKTNFEDLMSKELCLTRWRYQNPVFSIKNRPLSLRSALELTVAFTQPCIIHDKTSFQVFINIYLTAVVYKNL